MGIQLVFNGANCRISKITLKGKPRVNVVSVIALRNELIGKPFAIPIRTATVNQVSFRLACRTRHRTQTLMPSK